MAWSTFWIITLVTAGSIFFFRTVPLLVLADRELPEELEYALDLIPVVAFTALVVNDLFLIDALQQGDYIQQLMPLLASIPVVVVARYTRSLAWCIVAGVVTYGLLMLVF